MAADIRERPDLAIIAADHEDAFAEIFERAPLAVIGNLAFMTDYLGGGAEERPFFRFEKLRVVIEPARKAHIVQRIARRGDAAELRRHAQTLAISAGLRQWPGVRGVGLAAPRDCFGRQPEGRPHRAASAIGQERDQEACRFTSMFSSRVRTWPRPRWMRSRK